MLAQRWNPMVSLCSLPSLSLRHLLRTKMTFLFERYYTIIFMRLLSSFVIRSSFSICCQAAQLKAFLRCYHGTQSSVKILTYIPLQLGFELSSGSVLVFILVQSIKVLGFLVILWCIIKEIFLISFNIFIISNLYISYYFTVMIILACYCLIGFENEQKDLIIFLQEL